MILRKHKTLINFLICIPVIYSQFFECHDDSQYSPSEGTVDVLQFTWLGGLQYVHIKNGTPHYFRVPRVILISRQFVLSTAVDAAQVPDEYALGNVIFGDYERDESECHLTMEEIAAGAECLQAVLHMPIADVLLHPEYKHFGAKNSLALMKLLKPVKSTYMLPACLPFKNYILRKDGKQTLEKLYHVDYATDVPRDFIDEEKEVTKISLLPRELCYLYDEKAENSSNFVKNRMACTTSCGMHSGAPSLVHEHTGHWSIVAIAVGGSACPDPLRPRRPPAPPRHILIHPYVPWITAAIAGKAVGGFSKDDPFGFAMARTTTIFDNFHQDWVGHYWYGGYRCYDRGEAADDMYRFYHEVFQLKAPQNHKTFLEYNIEIAANPGTMIVCIKVGLPYRRGGKPKVWNLHTPATNVYIPLFHVYETYAFQLEAYAYNTSGSSLTNSDVTESCSSDESDCGSEEDK